MAKKIFVGVSEQQEAYNEITVDVVDSNIESVFDIENGLNYFVGSGAVFTSNNGSSNSDSTTILTAKYDCTVSFDYSVSSEPSYDWLLVTLDNETIVNKISGVESGSCTVDMLAGGKLTFKYYKDGSQNQNDDCATFSNMKVVRREYTGGAENVCVIREVTQPFVNMSNVRRRVTNGFVNVSNVARQFYKSPWSFFNRDYSASVTTIDWSANIENGTLIMYLKTESTQAGGSTADYAVAQYSDGTNLGGKYFIMKSRYETDQGTSGYNHAVCTFKDADYNILSQIYIHNSIDETETTTIPSGTIYIQIEINQSRVGTTEGTLYVSRLEVDGVSILH